MTTGTFILLAVNYEENRLTANNILLYTVTPIYYFYIVFQNKVIELD